MFYSAQDISSKTLRAQFNAASACSKAAAAIWKASAPFSFAPRMNEEMANTLDAAASLYDRLGKEYPKQPFDVGAAEAVVLEKPFCSLRRFRAPGAPANQPKVLLFAPMSGHYATLLRDTVKSLLPGHDVYITDWKNACDVPLAEGEFGLEDYIDYAQQFMRELGPDTHVVAVCQPTVPVLAAVADLAATGDAAQPRSMTLLAGPINPRAAETVVSEFGRSRPLSWFEQNLVHTVPPWYAGAGRKVYPGFLQLNSFVAMNRERHMQAHQDYFDAVRTGRPEKARKIAEFYDEYFAVCDMTGKFYLDTVREVFQESRIARGLMTFKGRKIDLGAIEKTALFTVEGGEDDIVAPGQTRAAQDLCSGIPAHRKAHHVHPGVGHFGVFSGGKWRDEIAPRVCAFIRAQEGGPRREKKSAPGPDLG
jgi:poly(3-hydroxybutyrate) depolymerase